MGFSSAKEALLFLGLTERAGREQVKTAYKEQIKAYHPDSHPGEETPWQYYDLQAAYEYLMNYYDGLDRLSGGTYGSSTQGIAPMQNTTYGQTFDNTFARPSTGPVVFGSKKDISNMTFQRKVRADHVKQEKRSKERAQKEKENFDKQVEKYKADKAYEEAMTKIHAHRAAEVTAQIIEAYLKGK